MGVQGVGRGPGLLLLAPLVVAMLPGLLVLQVLPRIVDLSVSAAAANALGLGELLIPIAAAGVAGVIASELRASGGFIATLGLCSQLPALPGSLDYITDALGAGLFTDAAFWLALFTAYVTLSTAAATYAARWWGGWPIKGVRLPGRLAALNLALGVMFLSWVIAVVGFAAPVWYHVAALCGAAAVCGGTLVLRTKSTVHNLGWVLVIAAAGLAAFSVSVEYNLMTTPAPSFGDMPTFDDSDLLPAATPAAATTPGS